MRCESCMSSLYTESEIIKFQKSACPTARVAIYIIPLPAVLNCFFFGISEKPTLLAL